MTTPSYDRDRDPPFTGPAPVRGGNITDLSNRPVAGASKRPQQHPLRGLAYPPPAAEGMSMERRLPSHTQDGYLHSSDGSRQSYQQDVHGAADNRDRGSYGDRDEPRHDYGRDPQGDYRAPEQRWDESPAPAPRGYVLAEKDESLDVFDVGQQITGTCSASRTAHRHDDPDSGVSCKVVWADRRAGLYDLEWAGGDDLVRNVEVVRVYRPDGSDERERESRRRGSGSRRYVFEVRRAGAKQQQRAEGVGSHATSRGPAFQPGDHPRERAFSQERQSPTDNLSYGAAAAAPDGMHHREGAEARHELERVAWRLTEVTRHSMTAAQQDLVLEQLREATAQLVRAWSVHGGPCMGRARAGSWSERTREGEGERERESSCEHWVVSGSCMNQRGRAKSTGLPHSSEGGWVRGSSVSSCGSIAWAM
jgi:hypothetical protein